MIVTVGPMTLLKNGPIIRLTILNPSDPARSATISGLIDTGAALTVMNPQIATTCGLIQRDRKYIHVASKKDRQEYPEYSGSIRFPDNDLQGFRIHGIVACPIFHHHISCLIGRDILRYWELTYSGVSGQFQIKDLRSPVPEFGYR